ncbi:hypothetical protein V494_03323, partial [Pseudogymnoascus sp. VKM F-4513 (FW-928)]
INSGSAVDFVKFVHGLLLPQHPQSGAEERTAVILANCGQLRWNRRRGRVSWDAQTRGSAVHEASLYDPVVNTVEGQRDQKAHIAYVLSEVVPALCKEGGKLGVIAIADSARYVCEVLDERWGELGGRMESLALVFPHHERGVYQDEGFKTWLEQRGRGYIMSDSPAGKGVFGPDGGKEAWQWGYGVNVYGLPVEVAEESVFPRHFRGIVEWMAEVARDEGYVNETVVAVDVDVEEVAERKEEKWGGELVGAEIWETEAGRAQLRVPRKIYFGKVEGEKGSVEESKKTIEGVNGDQVEAQPAEEAKKDTVQPHEENTREGTAEPEDVAPAQTKAEETTPKLSLLTYDGASDERPPITSTSTSTSTAIPPERMERLPSYVETDESEPEVKLSKEEKAAILQITVLSSPVRGKGKENENEMKVGNGGACVEGERK